MDRILNLSFEEIKNDDKQLIFYKKEGDGFTATEYVIREKNDLEAITEIKIKYNVNKNAINTTNMLKIKSFYPNISKKENEYRSLLFEFNDDVVKQFLQEYINKITDFLYNALKKMHSLYWKQEIKDNYITSQYNLDEVIRMVLPVAEADLDLILKEFDMKQPMKYKQVKIDENIQLKIEEHRRELGKSVIKNFKGESRKGTKKGTKK